MRFFLINLISNLKFKQELITGKIKLVKSLSSFKQVRMPNYYSAKILTVGF